MTRGVTRLTQAIGTEAFEALLPPPIVLSNCEQDPDPAADTNDVMYAGDAPIYMLYYGLDFQMFRFNATTIYSMFSMHPALNPAYM